MSASGESIRDRYLNSYAPGKEDGDGYWSSKLLTCPGIQVELFRARPLSHGGIIGGLYRAI